MDNKLIMDISSQLKQTSEKIEDKYKNILKSDPQSVANTEKEKGNDCVKLKDFEQGIFFYTNAIQIYNLEPIYFANRALCYLKLNKFVLYRATVG